MYGNVDAGILCLILLDNYLVNKCNIKRIKADSCIFFKKYGKGKLELIMSVHLDDVFMDSKPDTLNNTKEKIKDRFNILESKKVKKFLRVYYEWGCDAKGMYAKMTMDKDVKKPVEGYMKYTGSYVKVHKTPGALVTTISKRNLEEPYNIDK